MKIEIEGLDKVKKNLEDLKKNIEETDEEKVKIDELLNPDFMQKHSEFSDFDEMVELSEFDEDAFNENFDEITATDEWDDYVTDKTKFKDWEKMLNTAAVELISSRLGF
jgi:predicted  nucleic acid-binding Zn-ribbon protein